MSKSVESFVAAYVSMMRSTTRVRSQIASYNGVDFTGLRLLAHLISSGPSRLSDLADVLLVDPAIITRQSHALVDGGYAARKLNPNDARGTLLDVTDLGKELSKSHSDIRNAFFIDVFDGWTQTEIDEFTKLIEVFTKALNEKSVDAIHRLKNDQEQK